VRNEISKVATELLICRGYRHRWIPRAANAGVVGRARVWDWELFCENGCRSSASEWRDKFQVRLPGTRRQYYPTRDYKDACQFTPEECIAELQHRGIHTLWD
jgi:hypothetical protein